MEIHEGNLLQYHSIVDSVHRIGTPRKWTMAVNEDSRNGIGIFSLESLLDHQACLFFILAFDLSPGHFSRAGNLAVEIIAMRRTERQNTAPGLGKCRCP